MSYKVTEEEVQERDDARAAINRLTLAEAKWLRGEMKRAMEKVQSRYEWERKVVTAHIKKLEG